MFLHLWHCWFAERNNPANNWWLIFAALCKNMSKCVTSLPLQERSTSVLQTFGEREKLFRSKRRGKRSFNYISMGHYCIWMYFFLLLYWLRSLILFIFVLRRNKGVIHHQCAGVPHFAFVWYCLSKWLKGLYRLQGLSSAGYSSAMLTPSENLILSHFHFCLCFLTWHIIILQMQN